MLIKYLKIHLSICLMKRLTSDFSLWGRLWNFIIIICNLFSIRKQNTNITLGLDNLLSHVASRDIYFIIDGSTRYLCLYK